MRKFQGQGKKCESVYFFSLSTGRVQHILSLSYSQKKKFIVNDMPLTFESNFSFTGVVFYQFLIILSVPVSN